MYLVLGHKCLRLRNISTADSISISVRGLLAEEISQTQMTAQFKAAWNWTNVWWRFWLIWVLNFTFMIIIKENFTQCITKFVTVPYNFNHLIALSFAMSLSPTCIVFWVIFCIVFCIVIVSTFCVVIADKFVSSLSRQSAAIWNALEGPPYLNWGGENWLMALISFHELTLNWSEELQLEIISLLLGWLGLG